MAARCRGTTRSRRKSISSSRATGEMCLGDERQTLTGGQAVYIPPGVFHQLTNIGPTPLRMIYCYGPAGDVAHWRQELDGTLPKAGVERLRRLPAMHASPQPAIRNPHPKNSASADPKCIMNTTQNPHVGIIMNGVTGRMGTNQHLIRSILAIIEQGGVARRRREVIMPDPILVGRNEAKLRKLAARTTGVKLHHRPRRGPRRPGQSGSTSTPRPPAAAPSAVKRAIAAGKHVYCEKPTAVSTRRRRYELYEVREEGRREERRRPGQALAARPASSSSSLIDTGFFGEILSRARRVRLLGLHRRGRRRAAAALVELPQGGRRRHHRRHALPLAVRDRQPLRRGQGRLAAWARPTSRSAGTRTGKPYNCTADDSAYATFELDERRDRAVQLLVDRPRAPRRPADAPGRRHQGQRGRRAARLRGPALERHAAADLEPGHRQPDRVLRRLDPGPRLQAAATTPSRSSGSSSCGTSCSTSRSAGPSSRAPRASSSPSSASKAGRNAPGWPWGTWKGKKKPASPFPVVLSGLYVPSTPDSRLPWHAARYYIAVDGMRTTYTL